MNLLLLLTALFASLTGAGPGAAALRALESVAVVRTAEPVAAVANPARATIVAAVRRIEMARVPTAPGGATDPQVLHGIHKRDERRLE